MNETKHFDRFHARLRLEGILNALVCGIAAGSAVDLILALILWFTVSGGWWIPVVCGIAVAAVCAPLLYFFVFRPTDAQVARRVDRLGLKERAITMHELNGDESYMADRQRKDALESVARVPSKSLKIRVSRVRTSIMAVFVALCIPMNLVAALSHFGYIPLGSELFGPQDREVYYAVEYMVMDEACGYIRGEEIQVVGAGEQTLAVTAEEHDGWQFAGWDDGVEEPTRFDVVTEDSFFMAVYIPVSQMPSLTDGESDPDEPQDPQDPQEAPSEGGQGGGAGFTAPDGSENIIDGQTNYHEVYDMYYQQAMQYLAENESIPDNLRALVEAYFNSLK